MTLASRRRWNWSAPSLQRDRGARRAALRSVEDSLGRPGCTARDSQLRSRRNPNVTQTQRMTLQCQQLEDRQVPSAWDVTAIEWRTIDGTDNNEALTAQGAARTEQIRFGYGQRFPDGFGDLIVTEPQRTNPRTISNVLSAQSGSVLSDRHLTDWAFQ